MYTFSFIVGNIIPKSVKSIHSATKFDWGVLGSIHTGVLGVGSIQTLEQFVEFNQCRGDEATSSRPTGSHENEPLCMSTCTWSRNIQLTLQKVVQKVLDLLGIRRHTSAQTVHAGKFVAGEDPCQVQIIKTESSAKRLAETLLVASKWDCGKNGHTSPGSRLPGICPTKPTPGSEFLGSPRKRSLHTFDT